MLITRRPQSCGAPSSQASSSRAFDALVHSMISGYPAAAAAAAAARAVPPVNIWEDADHYFVEAEIPGFNIEDVEISFAEKQRDRRRSNRRDAQRRRSHRDAAESGGDKASQDQRHVRLAERDEAVHQSRLNEKHTSHHPESIGDTI